jgi:hypothetical protein
VYSIDRRVVHSLEVAGGAYVSLGELLSLAFDFLLLLAEAAVQHVVDVVWLMLLLVVLMMVGVVEAHIVDLRVLDVHSGHRESWAFSRRERREKEEREKLFELEAQNQCWEAQNQCWEAQNQCWDAQNQCWEAQNQCWEAQNQCWEALKK